MQFSGDAKADTQAIMRGVSDRLITEARHPWSAIIQDINKVFYQYLEDNLWSKVLVLGPA